MPLQTNVFYSAVYYASKDAEFVHAVIISVVFEFCRNYIFDVVHSHLRFASSSSAAKFGVYFKNSLQMVAAFSVINIFMKVMARN